MREKKIKKIFGLEEKKNERKVVCGTKVSLVYHYQ